MSYTKQTWANGDIITAAKLNHMEDGIAGVEADVSSLDTQLLASFPHDTASGSIASFPDGAAMPVRDLSVDIEPVQAGSGDPSPDNIRPISGWTECKVYVSPTTDPADATVYTIDLDGTRYGGTLDVTSGKLMVDRKLVDLGALSFTLMGNTGSRQAWQGRIEDIKTLNSANITINALSSQFKPASVNETWTPGVMAFTAPNSLFVAFCVNSGQYADAAAFKAAMSGVQFVYELATPIEVDLTPTEITTLLGTNNIFADCGDTTVAYYADPTLYINKKIAAAVAALS